MDKYRITLVDAGDSAVSLRFPQEISEQIHKEVIYYLDAIKSAVHAGRLTGILDIVPSYAAILICFNPLITDGEEVKNALEEIILSNTSSEMRSMEKRVIKIPVVYGGEYGPDLETVASHTGLAKEEIIQLHSEPEYPVYMIGFLAGFPYLGGMNTAIATPRLASPRLSVPAGSVGIAEGQTGIYSVESPGGWQIIGRTPIDLYNPYSENPFLISAGDYVRFVPIAEEDYLRIREASMDCSDNVPPLSFNTKIINSSHSIDKPICDNAMHACNKNTDAASLRILAPGPLTTIQDFGRHGYMDKGLSVSGAMDILELARLNLMLGNDTAAAGIEATLMTPKIEFLKDTLFAMSGITSPIMAKAGDILESFTMPIGVRTYFAFTGGIASEVVLESRSTDIRNGIGGVNRGNKLAACDEITLSSASNTSDDIVNKTKKDMLSNTIPLELLDYSAIQFPLVCEASTVNSDIFNIFTLYVTSGPQYSDLSDDARRLFFNSEYTVSTASDRMGIRFDGPSLTFTNDKDGNILTDGLAPGAIQVTPSGQPILMNVDAQTTGGYSKPFWLASISKKRVAQLRPGDKVKFILIKTTDAVSLFREEVSSILSER